MKKSILFTLLAVATLLVTALAVQARPAAPNKNADKRVQLAREKYPLRLQTIASVKQYEKDEIPNVNYLTAVRQQNWAGSGQSKDKMEYYYREIEKEDEPHPVGYTLLIVRRTYNVGSQEFFEEFVYDDDGNPLFWFSKYGFPEDPKIELRGYFDADGTLVRTLTKNITDKEDINLAFAAAKKNIVLIKEAFQAMYGVTYY
jgi:hypothetical protein